MCYFVRDSIQDTYCSYFAELTSIVYIHRHFHTTSLHRTYYYQTLLGSPQNWTVPGTHAKGSGQYTQQGLTMIVSCTTAMRCIP